MFFTEYTDMLKQALDEIDRNEIQELYDAIEKVRNSGKRIIVLGDGGCADILCCRKRLQYACGCC